MQSRPEEVARHTVERNGGEYTTDVPDLLALFGRRQLTRQARESVRESLARAGVGTDPDLLVAQRSDEVRLFLVERQWARPAVAARADRSPGWSRLLPRTWKGWLGYGFAVALIVAALGGDSEQATEPVPAAEAVEQPAASDTSDAGAAAAAREERAARRELARVRRERARLRRERARVRRERARARREREAQQAQSAPAPALAPAPNCHPSYDPCLDPGVSDYDCAGGSGDGPEYTGYVTVKGPDEYGLDSDGDGVGCES